MKKLYTLFLALFIIVCLITLALTLTQVNQESTQMENDLQYRSSLLAEGLRETVEPNFITKSDLYLQDLVERYSNRKRLAGLAIVDNTGSIIAVSSSLPTEMSKSQKIATNVMDADKADGDFVTVDDKKLYVYAEPLHDKKSVVGALLVIQNASYIDAQLFDIWTGTILRFFVQVLLFSLVVFIILRWIFYAPIHNLVKSLQNARMKNESLSSQFLANNPLLRPLFHEVSQMQRSLVQAQVAMSEEAKTSLEQMNSPWTSHRLQEFIKDTVKNRRIVVVSNREPYIHSKNNNKITFSSPASGMVSALEPVMQSCGGTWIAYGNGNADKDVVDMNNTIQVPPDDPKYSLRRVWLTDEEVQAYYNGFSNEGLWPLCHQSYIRPIFRKEDWEKYKEVNQKFAHEVLSEIKDDSRPIVLIQDFHLALVPRMIKEKRPDATIGIFWHIPWPSSESFSICPWGKEILDGILGADIIGFHTQLHCNNFIETVRRQVESLVDLERFSVTRKGHQSFVKPFPISIDFMSFSAELSDEERQKIIKEFGIKTPYIGLGLDRLDYTKGILERLKAVEIFLKKYPEYKEKFTFLQISVPSRTEVERYQKFRKEVEDEAERINALYKKDNWKPIILSLKQYTHEEVEQFYKLANFCLITSLDDGMNLVAKEFVAARTDEKGVLILSEFTGASRELTRALIVNPYDAEKTADAIKTALEMSPATQTQRMRQLRQEVRSRNIFLWSAELLKGLSTLT